MICLNEFDLVIVNSSGGKDSVCALYQILKMAKEQSFPKENIIVSHQDLGDMEWQGVKDLVIEQCRFFDVKYMFSKRRTKDGVEESLLQYVRRRGKWPSSKQRYCTSDFKRGPGARVVTQVTKGMGECMVLYVFGFRKEESPSRKNKIAFELNKRLSTRKRKVYNYLPIHEWSEEKVWKIIKDNDIPYHKAYDLGMPRLSCCFCIFAPFDALVLAGRENPLLLDKYVEVEDQINHSFKSNLFISEVKEAILNNYQPKNIKSWSM